MYSPQLLDHFERPRNTGEIAAPDAFARVENPACGDIMELALKSEGGVITAAKYRAQGCVAAIACGSALTELLIGRRLEQARTLPREAIMAAVGGLTNETTHASHLAFDALTAALRQLQ